MTQSREIHLRSRPQGLPVPENFELVDVVVAQPGPGQAQVRNLWMTVDPYMRGRMNDVKSYTPPFQIGHPLDGGAVGEVIASNDPTLHVGDLVKSNLGWREVFNAPASGLEKLIAPDLPPEAFLSVAGMPGLTAYAGLLRVAALKPGDVVFVSGAAGAVGSMVCQIAKLRGHKVVASAGGPEKVRFLQDLGVDVAIDYKAAPDLTAAVLAAVPEGIDVYFDNVGGDHLQAAIAAARPRARFAMCGMISMYNATAPTPGPSNLAGIITKSLRLEGFIVNDHADLAPEFYRALMGWRTEGRLQWKETIRHGLESAPDAFIGLFRGENLGKMLVKIA
ncbi:MAG: NADP-dependent oxidoreductase [Alphaproteobacteria bacterium]|nr:NADP-dependent oxidoreductase [Alphaproteobacteria bacterium]MBU1515637.1 NADP-dependent oxidoreductase [Alphaproteobacteria bacterium]MBU2094896.1 NADP-dependent oxidoreductase [Alphaproteobacteria bacterium]MBU2150928.1 NADP-dependent oxidoreductase [Alphaproteobacteria bacterium]MBU2305905.1 NADP-dependent oxidoreductase [Alphaproteobacteria bacterium]